MNKNKLLTKEQISEKYKKMRIAAIVGYCLNALLLLLIVLSMVFGSNNVRSVSSENELQPKNALNQNASSVYDGIDVSEFDNVVYLKYSSLHTFSLNEMHYFNDYFNITNNLVGVGSSNELYRYIDIGDSYYLLSSSETLYSCNQFAFRFKLMDDSDSSFSPYAYWRLDLIYLSLNDIWVHSAYNKTNLFLDNYNFNPHTDLTFILSQGVYEQNKAILDYFFYVNKTSTFTFNKQFNYNAPLSTTISGVYGSGSFTYTGEDSAYNLYDVGYFISNGQLFNQIKVWYFKTGAIDVYMSNSSGTMGIRRAPSGFYVYAFMEYLYSGSGLVVNSHDLIPYEESGGYSYYYANSSTWKNDAFRQILFLQTLSDDLTTSINAFNNNNQNSVNGFVGDSNTTNVFTLVGSAFSGLLPILTLELLPSITIGMLLFIPLVAILIFAIIRIIKK